MFIFFLFSHSARQPYVYFRFTIVSVASRLLLLTFNFEHHELTSTFPFSRFCAAPSARSSPTQKEGGRSMIIIRLAFLPPPPFHCPPLSHSLPGVPPWACLNKTSLQDLAASCLGTVLGHSSSLKSQWSQAFV
jgi:hypothetical protein